MSNTDDLSMKLEAMNISNDIKDDESNDKAYILLKIIEIGGLVILNLSMKEIVNLFSITKQYKSLKLIPQIILTRTMTNSLKEKFDNHSIPSFEIASLPAYPCNVKDLKKSHQLIKSLKCCFCLRAMLCSFSKVSSVSMSKGHDESSYNFKITKGTGRKVSVKVTGEFCNIEDEESFFHHNGEFFSIMPATCEFCNTTNCRLCGEFSDCKECGSTICGNCEDSYFICSMCNGFYCENCDSDFVTCEGCSEIICNKCIYEDSSAAMCSLCENYRCRDCDDFTSCEGCNELFCNDCAGEDCRNCEECGTLYCPDCSDEVRACSGCQTCLCMDCFDDSESVVCNECDSFFCDDCYEGRTKACSDCSNFYCLSSAAQWKKCKKCNLNPEVCNDCRIDFFVQCKMCDKLSICLNCSTKTDSCCKGKGKSKKRCNKKHKTEAGASTATTNPQLVDVLPPLLPVSDSENDVLSEHNESTVVNDESLKSSTKE